jgi:hypothetical protein
MMLPLLIEWRTAHMLDPLGTAMAVLLEPGAAV